MRTFPINWAMASALALTVTAGGCSWSAFDDLADEAWAPGQGRPGVPNDEVLHVHADTDPVELTADELELDETAHDELELANDELFEGEGDDEG